MKTQHLFQKLLVFSLAAGLVMTGSRSWADNTAQLKEQVQALQEKVNRLESQLNRQQAMPMAQSSGNGYFDQGEDPFAQAALIQRQMQRRMRQAFAGTGMFNPKMDMKQTDKQYIITMDIPGMDRDKINVETKEGMLIVSGERRSETEDKKNQYYRHERSFGSFMQAIPLPEDAQKDRIEANYKNGVLTVTVARSKKEEMKSESEKIKVN